MDIQIANTVNLVIKETKKNFGITLKIVLDVEDTYRISIMETKFEKINKAFFNILGIKDDELQTFLDAKAILGFKESALQISLGKGSEVPETTAKIMQKIGKWIKDLESNMNMIITGLQNCPIEVYPIYRGTLIIIGIQQKLKDENLVDEFSHFVLPKVDGKKTLIVRNTNTENNENNENLVHPNEVEVSYYANKHREEMYIKHFKVDELEEEIEIVGLSNDEIVGLSNDEVIEKAFTLAKKYIVTRNN